MKTKDDKKQEKIKLSLFSKNLIISCVMLCVAALILIVYFIFKPENKTYKQDLFDIQVISELTTLTCKYHNVAVLDQEGDWAGYGSKYVWFEFDAEVNVGVDMNLVRVEEPTSDGIVRVYLPPAEIFDASDIEGTISKPVCELGILTKLLPKEEREIISQATTRLKEDTKTQEVILQAYDSAKNVLEGYIINVGKMMGEDFTVEWISEPDNYSTQTMAKE